MPLNKTLLTNPNAVAFRSLQFDGNAKSRLYMPTADILGYNTQKFTVFFTVMPAMLFSGGVNNGYMCVYSTGRTNAQGASGAEGLRVDLQPTANGYDLFVTFKSSINTTFTMLYPNAISTSAALTATMFTTFELRFDTTFVASDEDRAKAFKNGVRMSTVGVTNQWPTLNSQLKTSQSGTNFGAQWGREIGRTDATTTSQFNGLLFLPGLVSGVITNESSFYNTLNGKPKDARRVSGLYSYLRTKPAPLAVLEDDYVLAANWQNINGVIKSTVRP